MLERLWRMKSENWGGIASMVGSLTAVIAGDVESFTSTICFLASEISFIRRGHTYADYLQYFLGSSRYSFGQGSEFCQKPMAIDYENKN